VPADLIINADDFGRSASINRAIIRAHREGVLNSASLMVAGEAFEEAVELACQGQRGTSLQSMMTALISAFFQAKMKDAKASVALYSVSSDVDGAKIVQQVGKKINQAILRMLAASSESLATDPQLVASMLQGMMAGVSRRILESSAPEKQFERLRQELIVAACAYLNACSARGAIRLAGTRR